MGLENGKEKKVILGVREHCAPWLSGRSLNGNFLVVKRALSDPCRGIRRDAR